MYHPVARHMLSKPPSKRFEMSMAKMGERERKKEREWSCQRDSDSALCKCVWVTDKRVIEKL